MSVLTPTKEWFRDRMDEIASESEARSKSFPLPHPLMCAATKICGPELGEIL